jgi:hypothetical protein
MRTLLLWPLQPPDVWILAIFALFGALLLLVIDMGVQAGPLAWLIVGLPQLGAWYGLLGLLSMTAGRRLVHFAEGRGEEPLGDGTNLNPYGSAKAFQLVLLLPMTLTFVSLPGTRPPLPGAIVGFVLLPLLWVGLTLEGSLRQALRPVVLWGLLRGVGPAWLVLGPLLSGATGALGYSLVNRSGLLVIALTCYGFFVANGLAGLLLYSRRGTLNHFVARSPETARGAEIAAREREIDRLFERLHRLCETDRLRQAYEELNRFQHEYAEDLREILHVRLQSFQHQELLLEHAVHYLEELVRHKQFVHGWALLKSCCERDALFRPMLGESLFALCANAPADDGPLVESLLRDFSRAYAGDPLVPNAQYRLAVLLMGWNRRREARQLLLDTGERFPAFAALPQYRQLADELHILPPKVGDSPS